MKIKVEKIALYMSGDHYFHISKFKNNIINTYGKVKSFNEKTGKLIIENSNKFKTYPGDTNISLIQQDIISISNNQVIQEIV